MKYVTKIIKKFSLHKNSDIIKVGAILLLGILIRFSFAPFTEHRWDMYVWRLHQVFIYHYNTNPFWPEPNAPLEFAWGYPPLWLLTLSTVYPFYQLKCSPPLPSNITELWRKGIETENMFEAYHSFIPDNLPILTLINKVPIIIADMVIALTLYNMIKTISRKEAFYVICAWLFNPYVIWISSVWGMFDAIPALFVLLSIHFIFQKNYRISALFLTISALFKLYSIFFIPIITLIILKVEKKFEAAIHYLMFTISLFILTTYIAYLIASAISGQNLLTLPAKLTFNLLVKRSSPDWYGENRFSNLTPLVALNELFSTLKIEENIPVSPLLMTIALCCLIFYTLKIKNISNEDVLAIITTAHFAIYLTYSVVNEQFLIWVLPLLLLIAAKKNSILIKWYYWTISAFFLFYIFYCYDVSYFVSPFFLSETLNLWARPSPDQLILAWMIGMIYIFGIKILFLKPQLEGKTIEKS